MIPLHFGSNDLDLCLTDGGELTHAYSFESDKEVKMNKQQITDIFEQAAFGAICSKPLLLIFRKFPIMANAFVFQTVQVS